MKAKSHNPDSLANDTWLTPPVHPLVFTKLPDSFAGPLEDVTIDTETTELDYEVSSPRLASPPPPWPTFTSRLLTSITSLGRAMRRNRQDLQKPRQKATRESTRLCTWLHSWQRCLVGQLAKPAPGRNATRVQQSVRQVRPARAVHRVQRRDSRPHQAALENIGEWGVEAADRDRRSAL